MKVSVLLRTSEYRGDHEAEVSTAHEISDGDTVEGLVNRLLIRHSKHATVKPDYRYQDWLEIRLVRDN